MALLTRPGAGEEGEGRRQCPGRGPQDPHHEPRVRRKLSRRMRDALDRLLLTGGAPAEQRRNERIDGLEQTISRDWTTGWNALEEGLRSGLDEVRTAVENEVNALREEWYQAVPGSVPGSSPRRVSRTGARWPGHHLAGDVGQRPAVRSEETGRAAGPGRDAGTRRRGVLRSRVAGDRRVEGAQVWSPQPRQRAVVAGRRGTPDGGGGGPIGGTRLHASTREQRSSGDSPGRGSWTGGRGLCRTPDGRVSRGNGCAGCAGSSPWGSGGNSQALDRGEQCLHRCGERRCPVVISSHHSLSGTRQRGAMWVLSDLVTKGPAFVDYKGSNRHEQRSGRHKYPEE